MLVMKLEAVRKGDSNVGSKVSALGELIKAGLPVPPAFVLTAEACYKFLKYNKLDSRIEERLGRLDFNNPESLRMVSSDIQNLIMQASIPDFVYKDLKEIYEELSVGKEAKEVGGIALDMIKAGRGNEFVAVRPSIVNYGNGCCMESVLNVNGLSQLTEGIKECWANLFSARALFYRKAKGLDKPPLSALLVQKMIDPEKAGVMVTYNPLDGDSSKILIEASWGLGETLVSGEVSPDCFVLDKNTGEVLTKRIPKKLWMKKRDPVSGRTIREGVPRERIQASALEENELRKLWELGRRVEELFGKPQIIEWCMERNRIFLLQSEPVTANRIEQEEVSEQKGKTILEGVGISAGSGKGRVRVVMNLNDSQYLQEGDVLVTKNASLDIVPLIRRVSAVVTDEGGITCKAAGVGREFGVPFITGTETATNVLKDGQEIVFDGKEGIVCEIPVLSESYESSLAEQPEMERLPRIFQDERFTATEIKVSMAFPPDSKIAEECDGVGLLKPEHMLTESGRNPFLLAKNSPEELVNIIYEGVGKIAKGFYPKPVWYRSLDVGTDKFRGLEGGDEEPGEANPLLGWHGIRRSLDEPDVFRCEVEALKRLYQEGLNNISIMLPFVSRADELRIAKNIIDFPVKLGISVETPAAALDMESFCREGVSFVSIDMDVLAQLTLGIDRDNERVSRLFSESHPAVVSVIRSVVRTCKKHGIEVSASGEAANNPKTAEMLVELGVNSISAEPDFLEGIKSAIARTERRLLLENLRNR